MKIRNFCKRRAEVAQEIKKKWLTLIEVLIKSKAKIVSQERKKSKGKVEEGRRSEERRMEKKEVTELKLNDEVQRNCWTKIEG